MAAGRRKATSVGAGVVAPLDPAAGEGADARSERLNLRLTAEQKRAIARAAALSGQSLTDYVLSTVARESRRGIRDGEVIHLSDRDRDRFVAALDRVDAPPLPGLRR